VYRITHLFLALLLEVDDNALVGCGHRCCAYACVGRIVGRHYVVWTVVGVAVVAQGRRGGTGAPGSRRAAAGTRALVGHCCGIGNINERV